jgi:hypothetical protein
MQQRAEAQTQQLWAQQQQAWMRPPTAPPLGQQAPPSHTTVRYPNPPAHLQAPSLPSTQGQFFQQPGGGGTAAAKQNADPSVIRACLPNLQHLPDNFIRDTDLQLLIQLNQGMQPAATAGTDFQSSAAMFLAAAAAQMGAGQREAEPAVVMAKALETVKQNPTQVAAGLDDRCANLHPARFLGGAVCSSADLFQQAREQLGTDGAVALCNYDMGVFGLAGCVTTRGWKELQNPGSSHLTLKLFSPNNLQSATGASRRLTLADADGGINVGEHLKEITEMAELKLAMRALCTASLLATPWNHAFFAIDGGLHLINYGAQELAGFPNRVGELVRFINHIIELNAIAWTQKKSFLSAGEIRVKFPEWLACSTISLLKPAVQHQQPSGQPNGGGQPYKQNNKHRSGKGQQGGHQKAGNQGGYQQPSPSPLNTAAPPPLQYCRRFNVLANCPNTWANCVIPNTTIRLAHVCDAVKSNGQVCGDHHPRYKHK